MATAVESTLELRGNVIQRGDEGYDEARAVYNGMIDKKPALIAQCANAADVMAAVNYGREQGMDIAIRGGGHNGGGLGTVDGGLVIDLSLINNVRVDPTARTVRVGGGAVWGDVDAATHAFGLAVPTGIISTTGVGGLTLGGGMGHLTRKYGLTIDNLLGADMVLADGSFVTVDADNHPDLFWAIRGGGGNFGVVTSFLFRANDVSMDYAGPMLWEMEHAKAVLQWYREFMPAQADEIDGWFAFRHRAGPALPGAAARQEDVRRDVDAAPARTHRPKPRWTLRARRRRWPSSMSAPCRTPSGTACSTRSIRPDTSGTGRPTSSRRSPTQPSTSISSTPTRMPTGQSTMHLYPIDGAASRVGADATPWAYRDAKWGMVIVGVDPDPANNDKIISWTRDYWDAIHPYSAGGAYVNFMMADEGQERVKASYRQQLRPAGRRQDQVRPGQRLPRQPEHQAQGVAVCSLRNTTFGEARELPRKCHWRLEAVFRGRCRSKGGESSVWKHRRKATLYLQNKDQSGTWSRADPRFSSC